MSKIIAATTMENSDKRKQYLEVNRQQLRREMDAMGYGQPREYTPDLERQARTGSTSNGVIANFVFSFLGSLIPSGFSLLFTSNSSRNMK